MAEVLAPRHMVLIRMESGSDIVKCRSMEQVARAVKIREKRGEIVHKVDCAALCWCDGSFGEK